MDNLTLAPGGSLIWRDIHREDSDDPVETNVAGRAVEFLFQPVTLDRRLILGDVFKLLAACPALQQVFREELERRVEEVDAGTAELIPGDDVFAEFDRPGFEALFETLGDISQGEVRRALRRIDDDEPAGSWLEREFAGQVQVRPQFHGRPGREFRKAFRAAGR